MAIKLWLDDLRPTPEGWVGVQCVEDAISILASSPVTFASLDHDLGDYAGHGGNGVALTDWMAENDCWPRDGIAVHSANPVGSRTMLATVDRYGPYDMASGQVRRLSPR